MALKIAELQKKYEGKFKITLSNGWLRIRPLKPLDYHHPQIEGPAFLDYAIDCEDYHSDTTLEDRSRNVRLRDENGLEFQSVFYCSGTGILQVMEYKGQEPIPKPVTIEEWIDYPQKLKKLKEYFKPSNADELTPEARKMAERWLRGMDQYILKRIPKIRELLKK